MFRIQRGIFSFLILATLALTGCSSAEYYMQGITGHLRLMAQREPIDKLLARDALNDETRQRLLEAKSIRVYASEKLGLPDNGSYTSYVELDRPYVIWSVVATDALSMEPLLSCFPVAGCVTYRGYYDEQAANDYAAMLKADGKDVFVGGVQAYSTLGWFDDPVLSSMLDRGDILLAEVVFHELAHQQLYVEDDTPFNEAFATVVGEWGVRQWLRDTNNEALPRYEAWLAKKEEFISLLRHHADDLRELYGRPTLSREQKLAGKQHILNHLKEGYSTLKAHWGGFEAYDRWFDKPINNARLASVAVYRDLVPAIERRLQQCGSSIPQFMAAMSLMDKLPADERRAHLVESTGCEVEASL
ncbi:MAG: aminopeptidase [bacterium]